MTNTSAQPSTKSYAATRRTVNIIVYVILAVLAFIWILPIIWLLLQSLRGEEGAYVDYLFPKEWTFGNYTNLFTNEQYPYGRWLLNTLLVAACSCVISTLFVLMTSYALSRLRFKLRKTFLNIGLILGMFPGFMSMAATYAIMEVIGLSQNLVALVIIYSAGAALGYQISKGYFDTISRSLDEAARIDGATNFQIFYKILLPLTKPIIVYTALTTFISPWTDYIFVSYFMKDNIDNYTVAYGLFKMTERESITEFFTTFCAGAIVVAIPITILFVIMQKFYVAGVTGGAVKG